MYHTNYVASGLVTGTQWDVILNKLEEKTELTEADFKSPSAWGNFRTTVIDYKGRMVKEYYTSAWYIDPFGEKTEGKTTNYGKTEMKGELLTTGASAQTEKYHIFDIAGNLTEWTEETSFVRR